MVKRKSKRLVRLAKPKKARAIKRKATTRKRSAGDSFYIDKVPILI